jgi:WD40 repeat protein
MSTPGRLVSSAVYPLAVTSVAYSPNSDWLAIATGDPLGGTIGVIDPESGTTRWEHDRISVRGLAASPYGSVLAVSGVGTNGETIPGRIKLLRTVWEATSGDKIYDFAYSGDGRRLATAWWLSGGGGAVRVYDTGLEVSRRVHAGPVMQVAMTMTGMRLVATTSAGTDQWATVFHADSGEALLQKPIPGVLTSIAFTPDGDCFATAGDPVVRLFTTVSGLLRWLIHPQTVHDAVFSADGSLIATACDDDIARVYTARRP